MRVFRLSKAKHAATALNGEGSRRAGGRWNSVGVPVAYCASTLSLAVLELLVHVDPVDIPDDLVAVEIEFPDHLPLRRMAAGILPANWRQEAGKAALQALGDGWVRAGAELGLLVPSVIVPRETNLLLNPAHADAAKVKIVSTEPFAFDPRLF